MRTQRVGGRQGRGDPITQGRHRYVPPIAPERPPRPLARLFDLPAAVALALALAAVLAAWRS